MSGPYALAARAKPISPAPSTTTSRHCRWSRNCAACSRAVTAGEIELYPGVHHGFAFPMRWCYDKAAAERHWERLIALYRGRLG